MVWLLFLVDQWGRRKIFMTGCALCALFMWWIGLYLSIAPPSSYASTGSGLSAGSSATLAAFYLWTASYGATLNGTPWVVSSEMYPQSCRAAGMVVAAVSNWLINLAVSRITPVAFSSITTRYYLVFAAFSTAGVPFFYFFLPETKQIPIEHMEELFHSSEKPWNANKVLRAKLNEQVRESEQRPSDSDSELDKKGEYAA